MNGPRGTGAMERAPDEWKTKPLTELEIAIYDQGLEAGRIIAKADFLSHIDSVVKKYPAMTYSMIKELKDIK